MWIMCISKQPRKSFKSIPFKEPKLLELIYYNIWDSNKNLLEEVVEVL